MEDRIRANVTRILQSISEETGEEAFQALHGIAHNIKGQGASFGYPLITDIGASLCRFLKERSAASETELQIMQAHVRAMQEIVSNEIAGDGGDLGGQLLDKLRNLAGSVAA